MAYKTKNTRQYKRLLADYLIKYRLAESEDSEYLVSNIKDISADGIRFWTEKAMVEDALVVIEVLPPPIGRVIHALARVVRSRPAEKKSVFYTSARFVEISEEDQSALNFFIERLAAERGARVLVPDSTTVQRRGNRFF